MFIYFFNGSHSYLGECFGQLFFSQDRKKKLKGGGGRGKRKWLKTFGLVRMTYGIRYLQNEPEEVRVSCKTLVRA